MLAHISLIFFNAEKVSIYKILLHISNFSQTAYKKREFTSFSVFLALNQVFLVLIGQGTSDHVKSSEGTKNIVRGASIIARNSRKNIIINI